MSNENYYRNSYQPSTNNVYLFAIKLGIDTEVV